MENWKETFEHYVPAIEGFLTSVLLEDARIEVADSKRVGIEAALEHLNDKDIILHAREQANKTDVIAVLDPEWYGLLTSVMLGIEEKERNETTINLLKEFSDDFSNVLLKELKENDIETVLDEVQVLTKAEMQGLLGHEEYFWIEMKIDGLADSKVRAEFLVGDPAKPVPEQDEPEKESRKASREGPAPRVKPAGEEDPADHSAEKGESKNGKEEEVISARHIEFAEFSDETEPVNAITHNMDLLKDVELDVSVELGRIELPLGKVLQLVKGSVIELEKLAGEPVDILVNGNRIALGEVVVIDEHFGVRISSLVTTKKRLAKLSNGS